MNKRHNLTQCMSTRGQLCEAGLHFIDRLHFVSEARRVRTLPSGTLGLPLAGRKPAR